MTAQRNIIKQERIKTLCALQDDYFHLKYSLFFRPGHYKPVFIWKMLSIYHLSISVASGSHQFITIHHIVFFFIDFISRCIIIQFLNFDNFNILPVVVNYKYSNVGWTGCGE